MTEISRIFHAVDQFDRIMFFFQQLFDLRLTGSGVMVSDGEGIDMVGGQIFRQLLAG